jgi:histidinol-phosphate aminotransferase
MTLPQLASRRGYDSISLYSPDRRPCAIDLSDNTNMWGPAPSALRILREAAAESVVRYPTTYASTLKQALATYLTHVGEHRTGRPIDAGRIVTGCGSDDVIDSAMRAYGEAGERVAIPDPSFAMIPVFARMNALDPVPIALTATYDIDVARTLDANARVTYLCSPNNPTGTPLRRSSVEAIVDRASGLVIIDEAYSEFAGSSFIDLAERSDNVLIIRTMSKAFGLAGLRLGYAVGAPALIANVERSRGPYKVSDIAEKAAVAALGSDVEWVGTIVDRVSENRRRFTECLTVIGAPPLPSSANFVLVPMREAVTVAAALRERGIAVRPFERLACIPNSPLAASGGSALRITIGPWEMLDAVLDALREVLP